jgi:hypothetical protein
LQGKVMSSSSGVETDILRMSMIEGSTLSWNASIWLLIHAVISKNNWILSYTAAETNLQSYSASNTAHGFVKVNILGRQ